MVGSAFHIRLPPCHCSGWKCCWPRGRGGEELATCSSSLQPKPSRVRRKSFHRISMVAPSDFRPALPHFRFPSMSVATARKNSWVWLWWQWLQLAVTVAVVGGVNVTWNVTCPNECWCHLQASDFSNHLELKTVNCSHQHLKFLPDDMPVHTEILLLVNNDLSDLYDHIPDLLHLKELDVVSNRIRSLGRGYTFRNLSNLTYFNLAKNELTTLNRDTFIGLGRLQILSLAENRISYIEDQAFRGLSSLVTLDLGRNQLISLYPEWFYGLIRLTALHVYENRIRLVASATFRPLRRLRHLSLLGNRINHISNDGFWGLDALDTLHLERNSFKEVPIGALRYLPYLKNLYLSGNSFERLQTGDIADLPIEEVVINSLSSLTLVDRGAFSNLTHLTTLKMSDCLKLAYLDPEAFINVTILHSLKLRNNGLLTMPSQVLQALPQGAEIDLKGNPLLCDCNVRWIRQELELTKTNRSRVTFTSPDDIVCDMPEHTRGTPVHHLDVTTVLPDQCTPSILPLLDKVIEKRVGDPLILDCRAVGSPVPHLRWIFPDGQSMNDQQNSNNVRLRMKSTGTLVIYHLKEGDSGSYTCVAESDLGKAEVVVSVNVTRIDIQIFPTFVSSNFVTLAWNGTARKILPQIKILYRHVANAPPAIKSITRFSGTKGLDKNDNFTGYKQIIVRTSRFDQTISNLLPESTYEFCISFDVPDGYSIGLSCTMVRTRDANYMSQGIHQSSVVAVLIVLGIIVTTVMVVCFATTTIRKYRQRQYICPDKHIAHRMSHIPLENLYSPLMSNAGP